MQLILAIFCMLCSWIFIHRLKQKNNKWPKTWPFLGAAFEQLADVDAMHDWILGYLSKSRTVVVSMPFTTYTYIADPADVEHVLRRNFKNYPKVLLGDGIFNVDGELWRKQRKTASFEFASKNFRDFSTVVFRDYSLKHFEILSQASHNNQTVDMQELLMRMTLDSICKVGFGVEIGTLAPNLPHNEFATAFDSANMTIKHDILSRFIELSQDPDNNMTDKSLRDVVLNFVIAGRDTSATTLSWAIDMIMSHQDVAQKLYGGAKRLGTGFN
ncbi:Cytochrome P450 704B1 [Striga hermonthica]|uniref:Cytochrome P450 704B1 n=1 Tax=Striga hermonthica TaxID=68872 RepID=A0A9N7NE02_STRHE|nr:Cytochrome P450 704B1 [Striga hermonthica]